MLENIVETLRDEFSDLADASDVTRLLARVLLAVGLAAVIGWEREVRGSTAGLRTHMILALGVALLVVAAQQSGMEPEEVSRVIQGVFAGIGFLGAGAIIKQSNGDQVRGLTTAASLWTTAALATACGLGTELTAIVATVIALIILSVLLGIERRAVNRGQTPKKPGSDPITDRGSLPVSDRDPAGRA